MEGNNNKGTAVAALSLGMVGVLAAWYGFSNMTDDDGAQEKLDPPEQESAVATATELREIAKKRENDNKKLIEQNVKLAIKELKDSKETDENNNNNSNNEDLITAPKVKPSAESEKVKTDKEKWSEYWAQQFTAAPIEQATSVADYN